MKEEEVKIIVPAGMFGLGKYDTLLDAALRKIAVEASEEPKREWAEKYGTDFENDIFMMHKYCWCDQDECRWCGSVEEPDNGAPNFLYKPTGLMVWWYKYIGRSVDVEGSADIPKMLVDCLDSISVARNNDTGEGDA